MFLKSNSRWLSLLAAVMIVAVASELRVLLFNDLGKGIPYLLYFLGVILAALYGGLRAGGLATVLSAAMSFFWVYQGTQSQAEFLALVIFVISCGLVSVVCESKRHDREETLRAHRAAESANRALLAEVAERKQAESGRQESEARLALAMEQAHLAHWEWAATTNRFIFSDQFYKLYGTTAEREGGYQMLPEVYAREFLLPEEGHLVTGMLAPVLSGQVNETQFEHRIRRRDGELRHIVVRLNVVHRDNQGQVVSIVGCNQDITDLRRAETALRESEARFRTLFEQAPIGVALVYAETGQFLLINQKFCDIVGYTAEEIRWLNFQTITHPDDLPEDQANKRSLAAGKIREFCMEKRYIHKDGSLVWVNLTVSPIWQPDEPPSSYIAMVKDITERKRIQSDKEKLETQNFQLQKSESLTRMAGAIAHNFNNKLAAVILNLELLEQAAPAHAEWRQDIIEAMKSAQEAAQISGQMLLYLGQGLGGRQLLDLTEVCRRSLPMIQAAFAGNGITTDFPTLGPLIEADPDQIRQLVTNLLSNAGEALGSQPGYIGLSVSVVASAAIPAANRFPIGWQPSAPAYACLEVADSGYGIAPADLEKIFDPFFTRKFPGRGLGLSVVLGILRKHRGGITVTSQPGEGSVFQAFLPLPADSVPKQSGNAPAVQGDKDNQPEPQHNEAMATLQR